MTFKTKGDKSDPNFISCYFILDKLDNRYNNVGQTMGDVSGSFSLTYIENLFLPNAFPERPSSIVTNYPNTRAEYSTTKVIVGIPNKNGSNLSKKDIMKAMNFYNINLLRSILPYVKTAGNDVTVPDISDNCVTAKERKELTLKYKNFGNIKELNRREVKTIIDNLGIANRVCLPNTNYF